MMSRLMLGLVVCLACACSSQHGSQDQGGTGDMLPSANPQVLWLSYINMDEMDLVLVADNEPPSF